MEKEQKSNESENEFEVLIKSMPKGMNPWGDCTLISACWLVMPEVFGDVSTTDKIQLRNARIDKIKKHLGTLKIWQSKKGKLLRVLDAECGCKELLPGKFELMSAWADGLYLVSITQPVEHTMAIRVSGGKKSWFNPNIKEVPDVAKIDDIKNAIVGLYTPIMKKKVESKGQKFNKATGCPFYLNGIMVLNKAAITWIAQIIKNGLA